MEINKKTDPFTLQGNPVFEIGMLGLIELTLPVSKKFDLITGVESYHMDVQAAHR
jgi:hypothetical protein